MGSGHPQGVAFYATPGSWDASDVRSSRDKCDETHRSTLVNSSGDHEMESCLKKLDCGVSRKRRHWANQQKAEVNKLELGNQLLRSWENLLLE